MGETIAERYRKALPGSWTEWEKACRIIPGGITHDSRHLVPFPLYVARAAGPRKWDVDGREYIDYWMGHGALFLGHSHPAMVEAVKRQVEPRHPLRRLPQARGRVGRLDHEAHPLARRWCGSRCRGRRRRISPSGSRGPTAAGRSS